MFVIKATLYIVIMVILLLAIIIMGLALVNKIFVSPSVDSVIEVEKKGQIVTKTIQIEILNATDIGGLAAIAKKYLDERGYDVVETGNYKEKKDITFVIDRIGNSEAVKKVNFALGIPDSMIVIGIDSSISLIATVVIGKDYQKYNPYK